MRFIFQYPEVTGTDADLLDAGSVTELARTAEASGWDGFAFTEHPIPGTRWLESGGHQTFDPLVALASVAAVTTRLRLLTYLAVMPYRNPFLLAKSAATVDKLSGGRLTLGVGSGYLKGEFHALGVDFDERNEIFDESLEAMRLHWQGDSFSFTGKHFDARDVIARPRPVQDPIPVWIGGNSKATLRRVAERAQGWMPMTGSPELSRTARTAHVESQDDLAARIALLKEMAGPRAPEIQIATAYHDRSVLDVGKDVERHRDAYGRMAEIGIDWVIIEGPFGPEGASIEFLQAAAESFVDNA